MSLHKLTAGDGYTYLTRQVAVADSTERGYRSLNDYYSVKGESPGRWMGGGLRGLEMTAGDVVTEAQMMLLFGEGRHPNAATVEAAILAAPEGAVLGDPVKAVDKATRLGRLYPVFEGTSEYRQRLGEAYQAYNTVRGLAVNAQIIEAERARIRTDVAASMFTDRHGRTAASPGEFSSYLASISRPTSSAIAGYDLTFSPVGSFSTLWGLADRDEAKLMEEALWAAVEETSRWAEQHVIYTRVGPNGVQRVPVTGLVAAAFLHRDARSGEPNLHIHWSVASKVQTEDGRWLAIDGAMLHKYAVTMSEHFNSQLEAEHIARVPHIRYAERRRPDGKRSTREIVGVDETLTQEIFSSRGLQIKKRTNELAQQFAADHGRLPTTVELYRLAQQANLDTRQAKHEPRSEAEQRESWREQAVTAIGEDGVAAMFQAVREAPVSVAFRAVTDELVTELARKSGFVIGEERGTWQHNHVLAEATRQARNANVPPAEVNALAARVCAQVLTDSVLIGADLDVPLEATPEPLRPAIGFDATSRRLYTSTTVLAAERRILAAAALTNGRVTAELDVQLALAEWSANHDGKTLNTSQIAMVTAIATEPRRVGLTLAPAGTGKTTAMGVLATAWQNSGGTVLGLAPTAAAARELSEALGGIQADTLHKLVWEIAHHSPDKLPSWISGINAATMLILDEAGLAGVPQLDAAIDFVLARGGRVELIGDDKQLAAMGAGGILRDIATGHGALTLDEVMRFVDGAEKAASLALREGDTTALGYYLDHQRLHAASPDALVDVVYQAWAADIAAGKTSMMTAPTLELVAALNARARADRIAASGAVPGLEVRIAGGETASAGDIVISKSNDRGLATGRTDFVKNGDRWRVHQVHDDGSLTVTHLDRGKRAVLPSGYVQRAVRLGYADTAVSVQGRTAGGQRLEGTCHNIIDPTTDRNTFYTVMTRGTGGNHAYLPMGSADEHAISHAEALAPATVAEMAAAILARDGSDRSATTEQRDAQNPYLRLGRLADLYQHALDTAALAKLGPTEASRVQGAAEILVPGITDDATAWPTLHAHLATLTLAGSDPIPALLAAAESRELSTAADLAAVLDWRLDPSGRHSQHPGPLPWLAAIPDALAADPTWSTYLHARADLVTDVAEQLRVTVTAWTPSTAPTWALPYLSDTALLQDLATWRAARSVPEEDLRPAGNRPHTIALGHRHDQLTARSVRHVGHAEDGAERWSSHLRRVDVTVGGPSDPQWPLIAARLSLAESTGLPVDRLLAAAVAAGPLPAEHPSSALWWRLENHLATATLDQPHGSHELRPTWSQQLAPALGEATAARIMTDRLWPTIVTRMDAAIRAGADSDLLARDAAGLLSASRDTLNPDQVATVLLWQISLLTDPPPPLNEPTVTDPVEDELLPPTDLHLIDWSSTSQLDAAPASSDDWHTREAPDEDLSHQEPTAAPPNDLGLALTAAWRTSPSGSPELSTEYEPGAQPVLTYAVAEADTTQLLAALADAAAFYQHRTADSWVPDYLTTRGLGDLAASGRVGYAPAGWTSLVDELRGRGYDDQTLLDAGLARVSSRGTLIDTYRDRLILPITTPAGDVVSFLGRARPDSDAPKYINGPTTAVYTKSTLPYGLDPAAAEQLHAGATVAILEGPLDVEAAKIAAASAGLNIVPIAAAGTALTAGHLATLNSISPLDGHTVLVGFDADTAGAAAAVKAHHLLEATGARNPGALTFATGTDPAQTLQDHGPGALARTLTTPTPLLDRVVDHALAPYQAAATTDLTEATRRHALARAITPALTAALYTDAGDLRLGSDPYRQFQRIAEATDTPLAQIIDLGMGAILGDQYYDTLAGLAPADNISSPTSGPAGHPPHTTDDTVMQQTRAHILPPTVADSPPPPAVPDDYVSPPVDVHPDQLEIPPLLAAELDAAWSAQAEHAAHVHSLRTELTAANELAPVLESHHVAAALADSARATVATLEAQHAHTRDTASQNMTTAWAREATTASDLAARVTATSGRRFHAPDPDASQALQAWAQRWAPVIPALHDPAQVTTIAASAQGRDMSSDIAAAADALAARTHGPDLATARNQLHHTDQAAHDARRTYLRRRYELGAPRDITNIENDLRTATAALKNATENVHTLETQLAEQAPGQLTARRENWSATQSPTTEPLTELDAARQSHPHIQTEAPYPYRDRDQGLGY